LRLRRARHVAVFLDFDGTLVQRRRRPEQVRLKAATRRALAQLAQNPRTTVKIISGRTLEDLSKLAQVPGVECMGLHGQETGARRSAKMGAAPGLVRARRRLAARLRGLSGIWIENKGPVFVVHYRGAPAGMVREAARAVESVAADSRPELRMMPGSKIWEFLPRDFKNKGDAVREALSGLPRATLPIYAGDDTTDEDAFRALRRGITVKIGDAGPTAARYFLPDPERVREFLERLEQELGEGPGRECG
jgi:trehalose-phosphatase